MADGINVNNALKAYGNISKIAGNGGVAGGDSIVQNALKQSSDSPQTGFSDMLSNAIDDAVKVGYKNETTSLKTIAKKASPVDLVTAINMADLTLQTVVGIRDRMINAYQDIIKMPI